MNAPAHNPDGSLLSFDFGLRRIGVAVGDTVSRTAAPLAVVAATAAGPDWAAIDRLVRAHAPLRLVVGAPYNEDGSEGALAAAATAFAAALAARTALPVERADERYSSREAESALKARRAGGTLRRRVQRGDVDSLAAALILERWLEQSVPRRT